MPHEIIVADDLSSDGSRDTIRGTNGSSRDRKGRLPDHNAAAFRGTEIRRFRAVTGDYVGILDGDDWFLPRKLERQVAAREAVSRRPACLPRKLPHRGFATSAPAREMERAATIRTRILGCRQVQRQGLLRTLIVEYQAVKDAGFMDERFPRYDGPSGSRSSSPPPARSSYVNDILFLDKRDRPTSASKTSSHAQTHARSDFGIYREPAAPTCRFTPARRSGL